MAENERGRDNPRANEEELSNADEKKGSHQGEKNTDESKDPGMEFDDEIEER